MSQQAQRKAGTGHKWGTTTDMFSVPEFAPINHTALSNDARGGAPPIQPNSQPQFKKFTRKKTVTQHVTNLKDLNLELLTKVQPSQHPPQQMRGSRIKKQNDTQHQSHLQNHVQSIIHASNAPFNNKPTFREGGGSPPSKPSTKVQTTNQSVKLEPFTSQPHYKLPSSSQQQRGQAPSFGQSDLMSMSMNFFEWQKHVQPSNNTLDDSHQMLQSPISSAPAHQARPKPIQQIRNASTPDLLSQDDQIRTQFNTSQQQQQQNAPAQQFPLQIASYYKSPHKQGKYNTVTQGAGGAKNQNQQRRIVMDKTQNNGGNSTISPRQRGGGSPMYMQKLKDSGDASQKGPPQGRSSPQKLVLADLPYHTNKPVKQQEIDSVKQIKAPLTAGDQQLIRPSSRSPSRFSNQNNDQPRTQARFTKTLNHIAKEIKIASDAVVSKHHKLLYQATSCQQISNDPRPLSNDHTTHSVTPGQSARKKSHVNPATQKAAQRLYPSESRRFDSRDQQKSALLNRSATLKTNEIRHNQTVKVVVNSHNNRLNDLATTLLTPYMQQQQNLTTSNYQVQRPHALPGRVIKQQKSLTGKVTVQPVQPAAHQELHQVLSTIKEQLVQQQNKNTAQAQAQQAQAQQLGLPGITEKPEVNPTHKFQIVQGNNGRLIRNVLTETRPHMWYETAASVDTGTQYKGGAAFQQPVSHFHLRWAPTSRSINFERMSQNLFTQMVNHYEGHHEISTKNKLFKNVTIWNDEQQELVFKNMLPLTFCIKLPILQNGEVDKTSLSHEMKPFKQAFKLLQSHKDEMLKDHSQKSCVVVGDDSNPREFRQKSNQPLVMPLSHFEGKNVWILKPTGLNRGKGIHVVDKIKDVKRIIKQTCIENCSQTQKTPSQAHKKFPKTMDSSQATKLLTQKPVQEMKTFVIQKYIESPFLMQKRKFDIRVWVLVTQDLDVYFFREGYLRMSCADYSNDKLQDDYVHLTNNAIQKNCPEYGQYEDGNQLSFADLRSYLKKDHQGDQEFDFDRDIMPKMKYQAIVTMQAVAKKLNPYRRKHCFELFGLDFMLDSDLNCWLIEANTNPCLEESSRLLELILPRMVDDMFKLTIDQVFAKQTTPPQSATQSGIATSSKQNSNLMTSVLKQRQQSQGVDPKLIASRPSPFRVPGYKDNFNVWEKLCNLKQPVAPKRSEYYHPLQKTDQSYTVHLMNASKLRLVRTALVEQHIKVGMLSSASATASRLSIISVSERKQTPNKLQTRNKTSLVQQKSLVPQTTTETIVKDHDSSSDEEAGELVPN